MRKLLCITLLWIASSVYNSAYATGEQTDTINSVLSNIKQKEWYEKINLRGYTQLRYNRLFETNPDLNCEQCDRSWGENGGFFFRRIRLIFFGNVHERIYIYIQPDFASSVGNNLHFTQIRDAYFDLSLDKKSEYRLRFGQSKVPFGFENMQSSQNRIPLDRNDGLNSAVANERDIGVFFYYAPQVIRQRFAMLVSSGLKGSGDYGVFAFGVYNGQIANRPEANNSLHVVSRLTYPFELSNGQIVEGSIQAYQGEVVVTNRSSGTLGPSNFMERRAAASFVYYAQPFGIQTEYNIGNGPEFNTENNTIENKPLNGGYFQTMYYIRSGSHLIIPFFRTHHYSGGKKHELDSRKHRVNEQEIGIEWQPFANFELVAMYTFSDRTFEDFVLNPNRQRGRLLRLQAQLNF